MTPEGKIVSKIMKWLRSLPATYAVKISDTINVGLPDIFGHHKGIAFYVEVKSATGRLSDRQRYELAKIDISGGHVLVARSLEELQNKFIEWFNLDPIFCESIRPKARQSRAGDAGG